MENFAEDRLEDLGTPDLTQPPNPALKVEVPKRLGEVASEAASEDFPVITVLGENSPELQKLLAEIAERTRPTDPEPAKLQDIDQAPSLAKPPERPPYKTKAKSETKPKRNSVTSNRNKLAFDGKAQDDKFKVKRAETVRIIAGMQLLATQERVGESVEPELLARIEAKILEVYTELEGTDAYLMGDYVAKISDKKITRETDRLPFIRYKIIKAKNAQHPTCMEVAYAGATLKPDGDPLNAQRFIVPRMSTRYLDETTFGIEKRKRQQEMNAR